MKSIKHKPSISVAVLLQRTKVTNNPWISKQWQALGVIPITDKQNESEEATLISNQDDGRIYYYSNFDLTFEYDELESYYQNLTSDKASIFIICHPDNNNNPMPFLVTLSYDEAAIYMETDELVYAVGINIEIYQIIEQFVLQNYQPAKRKKRRLFKGSAGDHYQQESICE